MQKVFFTSDLHLGHENVIRFNNRPFASVEEMDAELIRRWNDKVGCGDLVYVLGDMIWNTKGEDAVTLLKSLNGQIILIKGNHEGFQQQVLSVRKRGLDAINIEHLIPHKGNTALKFSWDNLFFSCVHCNSMKNGDAFDNLIIDCCKEEPEEMLWHTFTAGTIHVYPREEYSSDARAIATAKLLTDCFVNKDTAIRVQPCEAKVKALSETMVPFFKMLRAYRKNPCTKTQTDVCGYLDRTYKFAGFTRSYVRMHLEEYPGLAEYISL